MSKQIINNKYLQAAGLFFVIAIIIYILRIDSVGLYLYQLYKRVMLLLSFVSLGVYTYYAKQQIRVERELREQLKQEKAQDFASGFGGMSKDTIKRGLKYMAAVDKK